MARPFVFRLQPILRLREALEKEAQRHVARMKEFQREREVALDGLVAERAGVVQTRQPQRGAVMDLAHWKAAERYLVVIDRRIVAAETALVEAIKQVLHAQEALGLAHREHLMLVRLKERKWELHQWETQRDEAKEADDLTVLRFRRAPRTPLAAS